MKILIIMRENLRSSPNGVYE